MPALLYSVPLKPSFARLKASTSPPSHEGLAVAKVTPLSCTTPGRKPRRKEDDYHSTLKALNTKGRLPRKSLGQHYMLNASINEELAAAANVKEGDIVLEIGPGTGSLTNVLVNAGANVLAIEKDPYMAALVRERFAGTDRVKLMIYCLHGRLFIKPLLVLQKVVEEDFVRSHVQSHMSSLLPSESPVDGESFCAKVVANIPFNISTDVVKKILPMGDIFSEVILLLQDEAAVRLVDSSTNSPDYRPINIFVNFYSDPEYITKVSRTNFFPQPKVDAAVISFKLKQTEDYPHVSSIRSFFSMVNSAFNGKRKMLRKSLQHICAPPDIEAALCNAGLQATSRPEELTLDDFVKLHNLLMKS